MEEIIQFDKQLLLLVNGSDSQFFDYLILTLTNAKTWIPLYLGLFYVVLKSNKNVREVVLIPFSMRCHLCGHCQGVGN